MLETIPDKIHAEREALEKSRNRDIKRIAQLAMERLMFLWLLILPWRQRNIRECRVTGTRPNLFKGKIPSFSEIDKSEWALAEEAKNPDAEFWQISFSTDETKTDYSVNLLLPRQLVEPLEEYLREFRPLLLGNRNTETLFIRPHGKPLNRDQMLMVIGRLSLRHTGTRTTPHLFRDAVAFKWLKEHPKDFLNLSKMLWHKNVQTTVAIYGSRFNESSGANAMEAWLDARSKEKKS